MALKLKWSLSFAHNFDAATCKRVMLLLLKHAETFFLWTAASQWLHHVVALMIRLDATLQAG